MNKENEMDERSPEKDENLSSRQRICRIAGWTFYLIAALDFVSGNFFGVDFTGVGWSPILFGAIGYLIGRFGGKDKSITWW